MTKRVHFIGIGGAGLSALARIMLARGWQVSGSDRQGSARTEALAQEGATIFIGHDGKSVTGADVVVMSSAIPAHNAERIAAEAAGIPLLKRDRWLARITQGYDLIGVSGTHGKTTTTSIISLMLLDAGLDPTVVIGAEVPQLVDQSNLPRQARLPSNARAGMSRFFVLEADEYDHAFSLHGLGRWRYVSVWSDDRFRRPKKIVPAKARGAKRVKGFQTGDHIRAVIPKGKYKGTHIGRVIIRASGSFDIKTKSGKVSANWKYCKLLQRDDGYSYSHVPPQQDSG